MTAAAEVQALLRFLSQDAKIPLAEALPKIGALRKKGLNTASAIAAADTSSIQEIFVDDKIVKQISNAAKRMNNPRKRAAAPVMSPRTKRTKSGEQDDPREIEEDLILPTTDASTDQLEKTEIETNRAPLVLAFALVCLEYTMPEQPLSSRLSLAQAVVSANSQNKAKSIGLLSGATAEEEGWARGQPKVRVLTREIAVMRRQIHTTASTQGSQETVKAEETVSHEAFWGLDIEALRKSNGPLAAGKLAGSHGPPIHTPQAARSYLLKSFTLVESRNESSSHAASKKKKQSVAEIVAAKEHAAAMVLQAIRLVCESWVSTLSSEDLDRRAWTWYLAVRPEVAQGQSGWGQRGRVSLANILKLRKINTIVKDE